MSEDLPESIGGFSVRRVLGQGGMGRVYGCWDADLEREVAIKVLLKELLAQDDMAERFEREARAMAKVRTAMDAGRPLAQALRDARVWGPRQDLMPAALRRLSLPQLIGALRRAAAIDRMIKGLASGDAWDALLQLGLSLMTPAQEGRASANRGKISGRI